MERKILHIASRHLANLCVILGAPHVEDDDDDHDDQNITVSQDHSWVC